VNPKSTSLIVRKIDTKTSASLIKALEFLRLESANLSGSIEKFHSNESQISSVSVFSQSVDQEKWMSWLYPLTLEYCDSLLVEFLTTLAPSSTHPSAASVTSLPQLRETGKTFIYRLTCCDWIQKEQANQQPQCSEGMNNCTTRVTCRKCSEHLLEPSFSSIRIDQNLLQALMSLSAWEEICVGLVCGKISPIYITTAKYLNTWSHTQPPSVADLLHGLNEIRE
jgi:hypothetical protein